MCCHSLIFTKIHESETWGMPVGGGELCAVWCCVVCHVNEALSIQVVACVGGVVVIATPGFPGVLRQRVRTVRQ